MNHDWELIGFGPDNAFFICRNCQKQVSTKRKHPASSPEACRTVGISPCLSFELNPFSKESYSDQDLEQVIEFVFQMNDHHPSLWSNICRRLIISLIKERVERK